MLGKPGRREAEGAGAQEINDGLASIVGQEVGLGYAGVVVFALPRSVGMNYKIHEDLLATNRANRLLHPTKGANRYCHGVLGTS